MNEEDSPTLNAIRDAVVGIARRYRAMPRSKLLVEIQRICRERFPDGDDRSKSEQLKDIASEGSVEALAALFVVADRRPAVKEAAIAALEAIIERSPAIPEELLEAELTRWADDEVAAGRWTSRIDPKTGRKLYTMRPPE